MWDYKQCSPSWGNKHLGQSAETMCSAGCTTNCLSALSEWYGKAINPGQLVDQLEYTKQGYILWPSLAKTELPFKFVYRYYQRDDAKMKQILSSKDGACIVCIAMGKGTHWLVLLGNSTMGYKVYDPLKGDICYLNIRYKYPRILGFTEVTRK